MIRKAIFLIPALACAVLLLGRGESKPWKMTAIGGDEPHEVAPRSLEQVEAEPNPERRAMAGVEIARDSLESRVRRRRGKIRSFNKFAERRSRQLLRRLEDFEQRMFVEERGKAKE